MLLQHAPSTDRSGSCLFLGLDGDGFWDNALPADDFDALLVRPSFNVFKAADAALEDVVFFGAFRWLKALPAAVFDFEAVDLSVSVFEAFVAAFFPVTLLFCHYYPPLTRNASPLRGTELPHSS